MPDINTLLLFSVAAIALAATPGPDMLLIASRSAAQGRAAGFATWAGIAAGTYCHAIAAALGLSQLFIAIPVAYDIVRFIGVAYLLYLAWTTLASNKATTHSSAENANDNVYKGAAVKPSSRSVSALFFQGLTTNILNPKMILFVLALFPQFVVLEAGSVAVQIMIFATIINFVGFFINGAVILVTSRVAGALAGNGAFNRTMQYLLATVFIGLAARLIVDDGR